MDTSAIDNLLGQMRAAAAGGSAPARAAAAPAAGTDFAAVLKSSLDGINSHQVDATRLAREFELGVPNTNLNDVMISMQKANISFQEMVQVRNRLVSAYHDIMNMQV
ncbi:MAG: flagellar hook-basal body complex protein FliE [Burkholderiales bacterium]